MMAAEREPFCERYLVATPEAGAGALASEIIRFDKREEFTSGSAVKRNEKAESSLHVGVLLHGDETGVGVHGSHVVEEAAAGKFKAAARVDDDGASGLFAGNVFDGFDSHRHGEELTNLGFVDVEGHVVRGMRIARQW